MLHHKPQGLRRALRASQNSLSSSSSISSDPFLVDKAVSILKGHHPIQLDSLSAHFTPQSASTLLLRSQFDKNLTLKFLGWARHRHFFDLRCQCLAIHVLTRFKLYKSAQSVAQDVASNSEDPTGTSVFHCLKDSYDACNSSSSVFDLMVKSYSHLKMIDIALNTIALAKSNGFMPSALSYNSVLDAIIRSLSPGSMELAEELFRDMLKAGVSPNVFTYNILIRGFCVIREFDKGLGLLNEMENNGCLPNVVTYNTLVDAYCKMGRIDDAFRMFKLMSVRNLEPNLISYNVVINGFCREGRMKETTLVLKEMNQKGFVPDEITYNTLVNGYCKVGDFHQALVLHAEMLRNGVSPNVITYTSLINSMCKAKNLHRAMEFFDQMHIRGLFPNERTYTTLIDGFCQQGFIDEAYRVLDEMRKSGFSPSIVTYNALINGHCILARMDDAFGVLGEMSGKGIPPDTISYSTIISTYCRNQDFDKAFQVKQEMVDKGILPDAITYSSLVKGLCEQRRLPEACDLFQEMGRIGLPPDECTYTTLINAFCVDGDIRTAFNLHDEMISKGFLPDIVTYSVLINGLSKQARTKEAKKLLLKLFYDESVPNDITYSTLIENCANTEFKSALALVKGFCMKGLMNEAHQVFESMLQRNHKPGEAIYNVLIHGYCRSRNLQHALGLYREMVQHGYILHTVTAIALIKELFREGMSDEVSQVIENTLRSCRLSDAELAKVLIEINHKEGNMDAVFDVLSEMARDGLLPKSGKSAYSQG